MMLTLNWNIIWTVVNLIVLFLLLKKFLFQPVKNIMTERETMMRGQLADAEQKEQMAEEKLSQAHSFLQNADEKAHQEAASILKETEQKNHALLAQAQEQADKILADSRKRADKEREKLLRDSRNEIADMALSAAKRLAGTYISREEEERLFAQMINEAGEYHGK